MFAVRVSPGGPTAAPDAPPASDNAPATPNAVTAFVRLFRFEFCLPCDMVEACHFTPALMCNYTTTAGRLLAVVMAHDKAGVQFLRQTRAAGSGVRQRGVPLLGHSISAGSFLPLTAEGCAYAGCTQGVAGLIALLEQATGAA